MEATSGGLYFYLPTTPTTFCCRKASESRTTNIALLVVVFLVGCFAVTATDSRNIAIRVGATIGRDGPCAAVFNDTALGYKYFFDWFAQQPATVLTDAAGRDYTLKFQFEMVTHDCTEYGRAAAMSSLIDGTAPDPVTGAPGKLPVHVIFGGNGENAAKDSLQADAASRVLLHCCTARDSVFKMDLPHVYGLFTPASMYTSTVLRAMALRGLKKVAVVYDRDSPLFAQLCEGALANVPLLGELRPGFKNVLAEGYIVSDTLVPGFWEHLALNVSASGADALIACDDMSRTSTLLRLLSTTHHYYLSAVWLASRGSPADFLSYLGRHGELALTTMQWLPTLPYADPLFGTAAQYGDAFAAATGRNATYFSAAASVAGYVLLNALTRAFSMCKIRELNATNEGDVDVNVRAMAVGDSFMWQEGILECTSGATRGSVMLTTTGSGALRYVLNNINLETFFGPVGFNGFRQNVRHAVITAQVQDGQLAAVLPLDVADTALVMPIPAPLPPHAGWRSTPTGISIITLIACVGTLFALLLLFVVTRRRFGARLSMAAAVSIRFDEIQVDYPPVLFANGDAEAGEGMYKGTRVKLVVATEMMSPSSSRQALKQSPPSVLSCSPAEDSSVHRNRDRSQKPRATTFSLISIPVSPRPTTSRLALSELSTPQAPLRPSPSQPPPHHHNQQQQQQQLAMGNAASIPSPFLSHGTATLNTTPITISTGVVRPADVMLSDRSTSRKISVSDAGFKRPSESGLGRYLNCPLPTMSTSLASGVGGGTGMPAGGSGCVGGEGGCNRLLSGQSFGPMSKRSRDQALSLIWRAVRLQHPRMCPILGIVLDWPGLTPNGGSGPVVVRQWQEFDNLDRLLDNETVPLPLLKRANIAIGVAEGLSFLHAQQPPILAGPIEPARIIIDKHFNPRLFLRLRNLDPNYAKEAAAAAAAAVARSRALTSNPTRGLSVSQVAFATWGQLRLIGPPSPEVPVHSPTAGGDAGNVAASVAQTGNTFVVPFGNGRDPEDVKQQPQQPAKACGAFAPSNPVFRGSGGGSSGSALPDLATVNIPTGGNGGLQNSVVAAPPVEDPQTAWLRGGGGGAAADATAMMSPYLPYVPSKAQDIFEFGLLLCRLFAPSSPSDSGRMRLAVRFANVTTVAAAVAEGGGGGNGGDITSAVPAPISTYDDAELEAALEEMSDICIVLADLARACMQPGTTLSFPAILRMLEEEVLPALTAGCAVGSSPGLPKLASGGTGHWIHDSMKVSSLRKRVAGFGKLDEPTSGAGEVVGSCSVAGRETRASVDGLVSGQHMVHRSGGSAPRLGPHLRHLPRAGGHPIITPDDLLFDLFPPKVARALQAGETVQPERYDCVSIFFSDVVGYTDLCGQLQPGEVMDLVHRLYSKFDDLIRELQLFKVETVGDAYLAVGNLRWPQADSHARLMTQFAFSAIRAANSLTVHHDRPELGTVHIRVGLHCGPVVGSVVGTLNRRYCLFGDAVNTAARMEHTSLSDRVHCSAAFAALLEEQWPQGAAVISRGVQQIKGKGPMETFWVEERSLAPVEPVSLYGGDPV